MLSARTIYGEIFDHDEAFGLFCSIAGTSGHIGPHEAVLRECLLSSRSRVRVAVGTQVRV